MKLTFVGGAKSVTGANYLLEIGTHRMLIDCGLFQGGNFCELPNFAAFPYDPKKIDTVFITHAHIDHTGRLPKLYKDGFRGTIYSTPPTKDFAEHLLIDSEHISNKDAKRCKRDPIFDMADVNGACGLWKTIDFHQKLSLGDDVEVELFRAGHILGSAIIVIKAEGKKIAFTGDVGNYPAPIIGETETLQDIDYCLIESVYGNRLHNPTGKRRETIEDLIEDVVKRGGTLMIPAFAMERTQKLLYEINELVEHGRVPKISVFVDSPLAIKLTEVYKKHEAYFNAAAKQIIESGDKLFNFPGLRTTLTTEESKMINDVPPPKVIIAGSGMSNGGRILHHEKRYLSDPNSTILFIGYQAPRSLGRHIVDGAKEIKIFGERISVRCRVVNIPGYSAHADQRQLINWLIPVHQSLKKLFIVQGEEESANALAQKIKDELGVVVEVPSPNDTVEL